MKETGNGYLTVNVRTAGGALPVEGAMVTVTRIDGAESTVVAVMLTDSAGTSDVVALPSPPRGNSLEPGEADVSSLYTVDVARDGYYRVIHENVPIYEGVTSIQQIHLVPIAGGRPHQYPYDLNRYYEDKVPEL